MALWVVGTASAPPPAPGHGEQDLAASQPVGHRAPWRGRRGKSTAPRAWAVAASVPSILERYQGSLGEKGRVVSFLPPYAPLPCVVRWQMDETGFL